METKKFKKKKPKLQRDSKDPMIGSQTSIASAVGSTPRTQMATQNANSSTALPEEPRASKTSKPGLIEMMKALKDKKDTQQNVDEPDYGNRYVNDDSKKLLSKPNLPKSTPPVLVTEMVSSKINDPSLPAIREEKTQEEIILNRDSNTSRLSMPDKPLHESTPRKVNESASSFKDDTCREPSVHKDSTVNVQYDQNIDSRKDNKTPTKLPPIKKANTYINTEIEPVKVTEPDIPDSDGVPKLPNIETARSVNQDVVQTGRTDDSSSTQSSKWQTALTFVNQRINERLRKVRTRCRWLCYMSRAMSSVCFYSFLINLNMGSHQFIRMDNVKHNKTITHDVS